MRNSDTNDSAVDPAALGSFLTRFMGDISGAATTVMCAIGDRLGLFATITAAGSVTSDELAARTGHSERYLREWLLAMHSAGYVELLRPGRFTLPPAHAAMLASADSPFYMGGVSRLLPALSGMLEDVLACFRTGSGIPAASYPTGFHQTMWLMSEAWLDKMLLQQWVPAVEGLAQRLAAGARVAHLTSSSGRALILLAQAFPASTFVGFDRLPTNVEHARRQAGLAGVSDRVTFEVGDGVDALGTGCALVLALDVLHDAVDLGKTTAAVAEAIGADGVFLLMETDCAEQPEDNTGPAASLFFATSTLYSIPTIVHEGGAPLGMMGLPPGRLRSVCAEAGMSTVRTLLHPIPTFNTLYEIRR